MPRRPLTGPHRVTGDRATHAADKVGPATDYGADEGELVFPIFAGTVTLYWSGTGGNSVKIADGGRLVAYYQHLSAYRGPSTGPTAETTSLGEVGDTGSASKGDHLHSWVEVDGVRMSVEEFFRDYFPDLGFTPLGSLTPSTAPAGGGSTPITESEHDTMRFIRSDSPETGDIAMIDTDYVREFTGAEAFSMEANMAVFGGYQNLTPDQYRTLVNEATSRMVASRGGTTPAWKPTAAELATIGKSVVIPPASNLTASDIEHAVRSVFADAGKE